MLGDEKLEVFDLELEYVLLDDTLVFLWTYRLVLVRSTDDVVLMIAVHNYDMA